MSCLLKLRPSTWLSYLLQEFQGQSGHLICHRGVQHPGKQERGGRRPPPTPVVNFLQESTAQLSTSRSALVSLKDLTLCSVSLLETHRCQGAGGVPHPLEGRVQGQHLHCLGGWLPGAADREAPGCWVSAESPSQAPPGPHAGVTCKHRHPQVWPGGASWEGKNGQQLGTRDSARSWAEHSPHPTMQCPHPQDRAQKRVVLWGGGSLSISLSGRRLWAASIAASRRPGGPWPLPGTLRARQEQSSDSRRTGWGHQIPVDFRNFRVVGACQPVTHPGASQVGLDVQPSHGHLAGPSWDTSPGTPALWAGSESSAWTAWPGPQPRHRWASSWLQGRGTWGE